MKTSYRIMISVFAVLLYSLTAGGFSANRENQVNPNPVAEKTVTETYFSESLPFINAFALNDGSGNGFAVRVLSTYSNQLQAFKAVIHILEVQVACVFSRSVRTIQFFPVRIRKSDMLFPFHYFFESIF